ncbi:hypothetical protein CQA53_03945 [Helicobacter didelphidarum]|uniref:RDD domain-containing protein n=1 Tax=Helicobacter didelphidarum TaxID=2040648 RepID=A0A3D8IMB7_9HELI|nr:RDD family protein [Helicobacter didelphidarum]RDU66378.1 hypothetical protein CQA53_03945 [Helicobacter didelphidarum]
MDTRLENDLYRENISIAPIITRIGAYLIDMLIIFLLLALLVSNEQKDKIAMANEVLLQSYKSQHREINLNTTPDNGAVLEEIRKNSKNALDILLLYMVICAGLEIIYNFLFVYRYGATLGQIILKIKVVNAQNFDKPSLHICMKRSILKYLFGTALLIGFIPAFIDKFARTFYDKMSKTIVVSN